MEAECFSGFLKKVEGGFWHTETKKNHARAHAARCRGARPRPPQAYFVGRRAILDWLNNTFSMNLGKIEETASGAVACQLLDALYPGDVPMQKGERARRA